nr:hypothetical protein [Anaerolineae bacterium]
MAQTEALHALQKIDSELDRIKKRLIEIEQLLQADEAVRRAQSERDKTAKLLSQWRARQNDLFLQRDELKTEGDSVETRLYSGQVQNPRELSDLQEKVSELRRRHAAMEEPVIEAMLEVEQHEHDLEIAESHLAALKAKKEAELGNLTQEQETLRYKEAELRTSRETARAAVEPAHLRLYDSIRKRMRRPSVVQLTQEGECTGCGVQVTSSMKQQVRRGEVLTCPTCGRILFT